MKPRTYFGLALLFPYMLWGICAAIVFLLSSQETSEAWNMILIPITYYTIGIILWLIPYTLLAAGMWIWGRSKSTAALYKLAMLAPMLLFALILIEVVLVSLPADGAAILARQILDQAFLVGAFSLVYGYLCVGIALGAYKFLRSKNLIIEAEPPAQTEDSAAAVNA